MFMMNMNVTALSIVDGIFMVVIAAQGHAATSLAGLTR